MIAGIKEEELETFSLLSARPYLQSPNMGKKSYFQDIRSLPIVTASLLILVLHIIEPDL